MCCPDCEDPADHPHRLVNLNIFHRPAPSDFWKTCVAGEQNDRACDQCGENFMSKITRYVRCATCKDYDFCETCINDTKADFKAHTCSGNVPMRTWDYLEVDGITDEWTETQMSKVKAEIARMEREEEQRQAAAAAATARKTSTSYSRKPVPSQQTSVPAPAPQAKNLPIRPALPPRPAVQARPPPPPPQQQKQSSRSNSDTGRALLSLASGVMKGLAQVNRQQQALNNLNFGGGGGGGGGFDFASQQLFTAGLQQNMWSTVSDAASAPIQ